MRDEVHGYKQLVDEKFGDAGGVPHFAIGNSLGCPIAMMIACMDPDAFKALSLTVPMCGLDKKTETELKKIQPILKLLSYFAPEYRIKSKIPDEPKTWMQAWGDDPKIESYMICAHNILMSTSVGESMVTEFGPKVQKTPILMLCGEDDIVVCNEKAKKCFDAI